jgi:hypothetical protein
VFETYFEATGVSITIDPFVLSLSFRLSFAIISNIDIAICKEVGSLTMPKTLIPFAFIPISRHPGMDTVPMCLIGLPFAHIGVSFNPAPYSMTGFHANGELTFVFLTISPSIETFALSFTVLVFSLVAIAISKQLIPIALPLVLFPASLIDPAAVIHNNALAMSLKTL